MPRKNFQNDQDDDASSGTNPAANSGTNPAANPAAQDDKDLQIAQLQEELAVMTEAAKRVMADLQNFKRRTEEERADIQVYANIKLLESIFPAIDNLARAFEHTPEDLKNHEWVKGIQAIEGSLLAALDQLGLKTINQIGVPVDPHRHEVLMEGDGPAGQVTQIFEKGYEFNGKTIRPAKVQVGKSI